MYKKVAVIGAGVMGAGIACQIANNNVEVLLYDLENENGLIAEQAIQKQLSSPSSSLTHKSSANFITPLSLSHDLDMIKDADLIIEAIIEKSDVKHKLYKDLSNIVKQDTIIASNTSTFRLSDLKKNLDENFSNNMVICHFFNPPRFQRLLELVPGTLNQKQQDILISFLTNVIGKDVIICKDTPGFIANRLGCFLMELTLNKAIESNFDIEDIDYIFSKYLGFPSTAIFGLYDLIGLDVMKLISNSLKSSLPKPDMFNQYSDEIPQISKMISEGYTGRKGKGGFYKLTIDPQTGQKNKSSLDLKTFQYRPTKTPAFTFSSYDDFIEKNTDLGEFFDELLELFFNYVIDEKNNIADNIYDIDKAMQLGFAWKKGPFQLMLDVSMLSDEENLIDRSKFGIESNSLGKKINELKILPLLENKDSKLWKISDEKLCFEITSKMNILTPLVFEGLISAINFSNKSNSELIIYSDSDHFSAGADLKEFYKFIINNDKESAQKYLELGQKAMLALKYSQNPVISCAKNLALGGGCEILLHSDYIVAHQELQAGLVEASLGLIPGWGGLKEMILRSDGENIEKNLQLILTSYKSSSATDFAINFNEKNLISLANKNNLLEYALNNKFTKKTNTYNQEISVDNLSITSKNPLTEKLIPEIHGKLNEEKLLVIERKIFSNLLFTENVKNKIEHIIGNTK